MSHFGNYRHLLSRPYIDGKWDCYGLAVDYYKDVFDLELTNIARPTEWWLNKDIDLINQCLSYDNWKSIGLNIRNLKLGDGLVFACLGGKSNHIGIYVGNGNFIHHFYKHFSREEALLDKWTNRLTAIVRHGHVVKKCESNREKIDLVTLLPNHVKRDIKIKAPGLLPE